jgi:hypothetical protein
MATDYAVTAFLSLVERLQRARRGAILFGRSEEEVH